jgi:outer membrane receptor protein involved in Fe transport
MGAGLSYGVRKKNWDLYLNVLKFDTDGHQAEFDNGMGGTSPWDLSRDNLSFNVKASFGKFQFTGLYSDSTMGSSHGPFISSSKILTSRGSYSLSYTTKLSKKLDFSAELNFQHLKEVQDLEIFKPGLPMPYGAVYPNGSYVKPEYSEYKHGVEAEFSYQFSHNHQLLAGIQAEGYGVRDCNIWSSYDLYAGGSPPLYYIRNGQRVYYGRDDQPREQRGWIQDNGHNYYNLAFYIQDTFYPFKNVGVTIGGRYDVDSEFGGVFNPRGAIVWEFIKNGSVKLLYGQAYRAPNCQEQFKSVGFAIGNEDLKPERIKTFELGLGYRFKNFSSGLNFFYNKLDDVIYVESRSFGEPNTYLNVGENIAKGFEIENKFFLDKSFWFYLNYSYTDSEDRRLLAGLDHGPLEKITPHIDIAPHKLNVGVNLGFLEHFNLNTNLIYRSSRERFATVQDPIGPYTIVNTTLTVKNLIKALTISASVFNVFDEEYYDQEPGLQLQPVQPGRSFVLKVSYEF